MKELNPMEKALGAALFGSRFFIMGQVGALMIVMTSLHPFFAIYNIPAAIVLVLTIVWDLWQGAGKGAKRIMALLTLLMAIIIQVNSVGRFITPQVSDPNLAYMAAITMVSGAVGHVIILIGAIQGIMAVRLMD